MAFLAVLVAVAIVAVLAFVGWLAWLFFRGGREGYRVLSERTADRKALRTFAEQRGWTYSTQNHALATRWAGYPFDVRGSEPALNIQPPSVHNVVRGGLHNHELVIFQYRPNQTVPLQASPDNTMWTPRSTMFNVWAVRLPQALPALSVTDEGRPSGSDADYIQSIFSKELSDLLHKSEPFSWRIQEDHLLSWEQETNYESEHLLSRAELLVKLVAAIPATAWKQYGWTTRG